jgi:ABC-type Fe3+/spermidine/putrescine transport system ATPase subunit
LNDIQHAGVTSRFEIRIEEKTHVSADGTELLAIRDFVLDVEPESMTVLMGPSGCGKTTLLRVIAGLERADAGSVAVSGRIIDNVPVHERGFGLMFQEYALFPHRDVGGNVAFGLRMQHMPAAQIAARVAEMLELVGLAGYDRRRVYQLSGGERQRVALARSLAPSPRLLMLDEPLGALDRALRERLLDELRVILKRVGVTSIYVTHDQAEAFAIADWLVLMNAGRVEQQGRPEEVYRHPATPFAARFLGLSNLIAGHVIERGAAGLLLETPLGRLLAASGSTADGRAAAITLVIHPEAATLAPEETLGRANVIAGTLAQRSFRGSRTRVTVQHQSGLALEFELDGAGLPAVGEPIVLALRPEAISLIRSEYD